MFISFKILVSIEIFFIETNDVKIERKLLFMKWKIVLDLYLPAHKENIKAVKLIFIKKFTFINSFRFSSSLFS